MNTNAEEILKLMYTAGPVGFNSIVLGITPSGKLIPITGPPESMIIRPEELNNLVKDFFEKKVLTVEFTKTHPDAVIPTRAFPTDIGYDLTAISVKKQLSENTYLFDTGIAVKPPTGCYTEILPRSSISKTGWMLSNSVGLIDPSYRGNLLIALTRVDESAGCDLTKELPFVRCQLILRKAELFDMKQVETLDETARGSGGFGSTDKQ
jgi:deoxyuridine 5'-triphosphate nucleotidohydrolase